MIMYECLLHHASVDPNGTIFRMNSRMIQKVYPGPSWWLRSSAQGETSVKRPLKLMTRMAALTSLQNIGAEWSEISSSAEAHSSLKYGFVWKIGIFTIVYPSQLVILEFYGILIRKLHQRGWVQCVAGQEPSLRSVKQKHLVAKLLKRPLRKRTHLGCHWKFRS